jgi:hypothetical protein
VCVYTYITPHQKKKKKPLVIYTHPIEEIVVTNFVEIKQHFSKPIIKKKGDNLPTYFYIIHKKNIFLLQNGMLKV